MKRTKVGNIYGVPVDSGDHYPILVTCIARGNTLGYVFPFQTHQLEVRLQAGKLRPEDSAFHILFGRESIEDGEWPMVASLEGFLEEEWPIPCFVRHDPLSDIFWRLHFSRDDLMFESKRERITPEEAKALKTHSFSAAGGVEARVESIFGSGKEETMN